MTDLLDVNLLVSMAWPSHVHHAAATSWFTQREGRPWATTPFTEAGFVRVSSHVAVIPEAVTPGEALEALDRMRGVPGHTFLVDDVPLVVGDQLAAARIVSHRQVTDAHLVALARRHGARLATLDRGVARLGGGDHVMVVPYG